jgi:hypothetical protein
MHTLFLTESLIPIKSTDSEEYAGTTNHFTGWSTGSTLGDGSVRVCSKSLKRIVSGDVP